MANMKLLIFVLIKFIYVCTHPLDFEDSDLIPPNDLDLQVPTNIALEEYRLKSNVLPVHYTIQMDPIFEATEGIPQDKAFTFNGKVSIIVNAQVENVKEIELHASSLTIKTLQIFNPDGIFHPRNEWTYDNQTEKLNMPLLAALTVKANYTVYIEYTGILNDDMKGFYRSHYKEGGNKQWLASTQFQQTAARKAFPCFDEPKFKATFELTLIRPMKYSETITNTKLLRNSTSEQEGKVSEKFKTTPPMSTYLMAFVVQKFRGKQTEDKHFGVFARPEAEAQLSYAFGVGDKLLNELGKWINFPYNQVQEIEKVDMIAVPDFKAGAMENWGAIIYRETALLWDEKESSALNKQRIASVIAHELSHYWFGDLVTCDWWSETWLNEGFARYFQYFGTHLVEQNFDLPSQFVVDQVQTAFRLDSTPSTHPMTNPNVGTPAQAAAMFDNISYNKGSSIIRMLEHHIGSSAFKQALQEYISNHKYKTVKPSDLLNAFLAKVTDKPKMTEIFNTWTTQSGYPVISVTSKEGNKLKLSQKRFLIHDNDHGDKTRYTIPITYTVQQAGFTDTQTKKLFSSTDADNFELELLGTNDLNLYILNVQQVGFYRVNYDRENWLAIQKMLESANREKIHELNRAQIVDDLLNLARAGYHKYDFVMKILNYLQNEKHYAPWLAALKGLSHIETRIANGELAERYKKHMLFLIEKIYKDLGFEPKPNEKHLDTLNRANVLLLACNYGHQDCVSKALQEFKKFKTEKDYKINPNVRVPVYCTAIRNGNRDDFEYLLDLFNKTNVAAEEINILSALGCTKKQELIDVFMDRILSENIRNQDKDTAFVNAYTGNLENIDLVYNYLVKNYQNWEKVIGNVGSAFAKLAEHFTTEAQIKNLEDFARQKEQELDESNKKRISDAIANAKNNLKWDKARLVELKEHFKNMDGSASSISISLSLLLLSFLIIFNVN